MKRGRRGCGSKGDRIRITEPEDLWRRRRSVVDRDIISMEAGVEVSSSAAAERLSWTGNDMSVRFSLSRNK
ncbi:Cna B-type domain-containing protein [Sesbania bispinosa]|nr:Cna B-type domain-containing protein [Sesbania bispinosa]